MELLLLFGHIWHKEWFDASDLFQHRALNIHDIICDQMIELTVHVKIFGAIGMVYLFENDVDFFFNLNYTLKKNVTKISNGE